MIGPEPSVTRPSTPTEALVAQVWYLATVPDVAAELDRLQATQPAGAASLIEEGEL